MPPASCWVASQDESSEESGPKTYWLKILDDSFVEVQSHSHHPRPRCVNCSPVACKSNVSPGDELDLWEHASFDLKFSDTEKLQRLIDWNVGVQLSYSKLIACRRNLGRMSTISSPRSNRLADGRRLSLQRPARRR